MQLPTLRVDMKAFCTYCSKEKDRPACLMPALQRYRNSRIRRVAELARQHSARFLVLSGRFGLLEADDPVPYYDHLLQPQDVPHIVKVVAAQLTQKGIDHIRFFTKPIQSRPQLRPYIEVIERACVEATAVLELEVLEDKEMSEWREIMKQAEDAKRTLIAERSQGEERFNGLLRQYPSDGMLYFKRGEAYEAIGERALALQDYKRAEQFFPMPPWKQRAREGEKRCEPQKRIGFSP